MKKKINILLTVLLLSGLVVGCRSFTVKVENGAFQNAKKVSVDLWHEWVKGDLVNSQALYERYIQNGKKLPVIITFYFNSGGFSQSGDRGGNLANTMDIRVDGKKFKLPLKDISEKTYTTSAYYQSGNSYSLRQRDYKELSCKVVMTTDLENALKKSESFLIRFYYGGRPAIFQTTLNQLEAIKKFLNTDGRGNSND